MDHYEFLAQLYEIVKPRVYLEIGVRSGDSLQLALPHAGRIAGVDIDTSQALHLASPTVGLYECSSYDFFHVHVPDFTNENDESELDLVLIDGSHRIEDVWQDFLGAEVSSGPRTIICFDDVLPRNSWEATRDPHEGAWAGDVWKIWYLLREQRPDMLKIMVDTQPCGKLLVFPNTDGGLRTGDPIDWDKVTIEVPVPNEILNRSMTMAADLALAYVGTLR